MADLTIRLEEARKLRATVKALQERQRALDKEIIDTLFAEGKTGIKVDGEGAWSIQSRTTSKLDKGKLVLAGVSPQQIEAATVETTSAPFLVWREAKAGDDSSD